MNTNPTMQAVLAPGVLLVLSAPSGAGKTTLAHRLLKEFPSARFSCSYTTRAPRGTEKDGIDYRFVDTTTFQEMIDRGDFVEWAEVHGNFYGSARSLVDAASVPGGLAVFDIDVQGGQSIKRKYPDAVLVFILPPSMEELQRRLSHRATDSEDVIRRRMLAARSEVERGVHAYDYLIVNDQLDVAYDELRAILLAERCRRGRVNLRRLNLQGLENP